VTIETAFGSVTITFRRLSVILKSAPLIDPLMGTRIAVLLSLTLMSGRLRRHALRARSLSA